MHLIQMLPEKVEIPNINFDKEISSWFSNFLIFVLEIQKINK